MMTWATRLNHTSARIAGGAGQQSRAEQLHHRNRQGTRRRADQRESSGFDVRDHTQQQHEQGKVQHDAGAETGQLQQQNPRQRAAGDAAPLQHAPHHATGHRTGRGRKNEQYCDGDGGKRIA